jgi:lariat debranching enzyme
MKIAVEGCCHGELDAIYASIKRLETEKSQKIDLLLIGGDFQVSHNNSIY